MEEAARAVDKMRAARLVLALLTDSTDQFTLTLSEIFGDDYGDDGMHAVCAVFALLAFDLAAALERLEGHDVVVDMLRAQLLVFLAQNEKG